jgi:hypothetical protein
MKRFLITTTINGDPRRTQDHTIAADNTYHARWIFSHLHPSTPPLAIRPVPHGR